MSDNTTDVASPSDLSEVVDLVCHVAASICKDEHEWQTWGEPYVKLAIASNRHMLPDRNEEELNERSTRLQFCVGKSVSLVVRQEESEEFLLVDDVHVVLQRHFTRERALKLEQAVRVYFDNFFSYTTVQLKTDLRVRWICSSFCRAFQLYVADLEGSTANSRNGKSIEESKLDRSTVEVTTAAVAHNHPANIDQTILANYSAVVPYFGWRVGAMAAVGGAMLAVSVYLSIPGLLVSLFNVVAMPSTAVPYMLGLKAIIASAEIEVYVATAIASFTAGAATGAIAMYGRIRPIEEFSLEFLHHAKEDELAVGEKSRSEAQTTGRHQTTSNAKESNEKRGKSTQQILTESMLSDYCKLGVSYGPGDSRLAGSIFILVPGQVDKDADERMRWGAGNCSTVVDDVDSRETVTNNLSENTVVTVVTSLPVDNVSRSGVSQSMRGRTVSSHAGSVSQRQVAFFTNFGFSLRRSSGSEHSSSRNRQFPLEQPVNVEEDIQTHRPSFDTNIIDDSTFHFSEFASITDLGSCRSPHDVPEIGSNLIETSEVDPAMSMFRDVGSRIDIESPGNQQDQLTRSMLELVRMPTNGVSCGVEEESLGIASEPTMDPLNANAFFSNSGKDAFSSSTLCENRHRWEITVEEHEGSATRASCSMSFSEKVHLVNAESSMNNGSVAGRVGVDSNEITVTDEPSESFYIVDPMDHSSYQLGGSYQQVGATLTFESPYVPKTNFNVFPNECNVNTEPKKNDSEVEESWHDVKTGWWRSVVPIGDPLLLIWETQAIRRYTVSVRNYFSQSIRDCFFDALTGLALSPIKLPINVINSLLGVADEWSVALDKARQAGILLAQTLLCYRLQHLRSDGKSNYRPISLVGYGFGARVIFECLVSLADHYHKYLEAELTRNQLTRNQQKSNAAGAVGETVEVGDGKRRESGGSLLNEEYDEAELLLRLVDGLGIVEHVVLMGAPVGCGTALGTSPEALFFGHLPSWKAARRMVAGRFINVYSTRDWVLATLYRMKTLDIHVGGIQPVVLPRTVEPFSSGSMKVDENIPEYSQQNDQMEWLPPEAIENKDMSKLIGSVLDYADNLQSILSELHLE